MMGGMTGLVLDGTCRNCGKTIRETKPWEWTHSRGRYHCNDQDITSRDYAEPDRETMGRARDRHATPM